MRTIQSKSKSVKSKNTAPVYPQNKTPENEQLRQFLTYYANMSRQKKIVVFFMKRIIDPSNPDRESLKPVSVTLGSVRSLGFEDKARSSNKGFVLYAKHLTNNICENIIQESSMPDRKIEVFFSVQELKKNVRTENDVTNIVTFPYFDDIPDSYINKDLLVGDYTLTVFPFPIQCAVETSPGNLQLFWCLKFPQPVKNVNYWKQVLSVMKIVGNNIVGQVDSGGSNINQIYRLPHTYNYKSKYGGPQRTKFAHFDKTKALEFRNVWTWILHKYIQIKYHDFYKLNKPILDAILKANDYLLLENLTGDFEHHAGKEQTPSERSMSAINRLKSKYKFPQDNIFKLWENCPNESKSKGHLTKNPKQYFSRIWGKLKDADEPEPPSEIKPVNAAAITDRAVSIQTFFEIPALLFSRKAKIKIQLDKNRKIARISNRGLNTKTGTVFLWMISKAVQNNHEFDMPTKDFFKRWNYSDKTFDRFQESLEFFLFTDSKYKTIRNFKNSTLNIIGSLERSGGRIRLSLAEDFRKVLKNERIKKVFSNDFFTALDHAKERYTMHLLFILNFVLYHNRYKSSISLEELSQRLGVSIDTASAEKITAKRIRESLDEIIKLNIFNFSYEYDSNKKIFRFEKHKSLDFDGKKTDT